MPSYSPSRKALPALLDAARPFLRSELHLVDPALPGLISALCSVGAGECWHRADCFLSHLTDVYRILKLWGASDPVALCGLFHSVYSNSYIDLALFDLSAGGRDLLCNLIGPTAERLVYLFCVVPRQTLIHDDLIFRYSDQELLDHLSQSYDSLRRAKEEGELDSTEPWRRKIQSLLPVDGITVKHIKTGEDVRLSRRMIATFLLMTLADFSDQLYGYQDDLFDNEDGRMEYAGDNSKVVWPGDGRPGLWMSLISRMGAVYALIVREEEIYIEERGKGDIGKDFCDSGRDEEILDLVVPPVFEGCTKVLDPAKQVAARDLYWEAVCGRRGGLRRVGELMSDCCEKNPYIGEAHLVLGQVYVSEGRYEEAEREAETGLRLLLEWGSPWDKRISWGGWVAWGRLLLAKAKERSWPTTAFGILNLGLVRS